MIQVGIRLPTLLSQASDKTDIRDLAQRVEELEFDSVWCVDHLLAAEYVFGSASVEPLELLPYLAGCTSRLRIGVSVLISPLRHQFWLLKQLGSLSWLAGSRIMLGLGAGWDQREFRVSGVELRSRGARLDALLEALLTARRDGRLVFDGEPVEPAPGNWDAILVGGGSSATVIERGESLRMGPAVARRIASADGWVVRSSAPAAMMASDLNAIKDSRRSMGKAEQIQVVRATFLHVSEAADDEVALTEQAAAMRSIGWSGGTDALAAAYPSGSISTLLRRLQDEIALGVSHFVLHPVGQVEQQLERIARHVLPALRQTAAADSTS